MNARRFAVTWRVGRYTAKMWRSMLIVSDLDLARIRRLASTTGEDTNGAVRSLIEALDVPDGTRRELRVLELHYQPENAGHPAL